jgi:predicted enzyme related to lactoylglutathione lyase
MNSHPIVHLELSAQDPAAASKFYKDAFGWEIDASPIDEKYTYYQFKAEGGPAGGFNQVNNEYPAGQVIPYIVTDDIDASLAKVTAAGGKVVLPKSEIPHVGWFAHFADPTGNRIGLYTRMQMGS